MPADDYVATGVLVTEALQPAYRSSAAAPSIARYRASQVSVSTLERVPARHHHEAVFELVRHEFRVPRAVTRHFGFAAMTVPAKNVAGLRRPGQVRLSVCFFKRQRQ